MSAPRSVRTTMLVTACTALLVAIGWYATDASRQPPPPRAASDSAPQVRLVDTQAAEDNAPTQPVAPQVTAFDGVDVQLARIGAGAEPERLTSPAHTRIGDRLRIGISTDRELHVYAFNQESGGAVTVMFPLVMLDQGNPLPGGEHELPGAVKGATQSYTVESTAAGEQILLVLATAPLMQLQDRVDALAAAPERAANDAGDYSALDALVSLARSANPEVELRIERWQLLHDLSP